MNQRLGWDFLKRLPKIPIAKTISITTALFWVFVLTKKFYTFGYYDWDLAFFTQATWNLLHGKSFVSLVGINYFGDHSYFFTFIILPIFYLAPSALTLLYLKVIAFAISGFLLYRIAVEEIGETPALYFMILYFLFPGNIFGLLYEFNPEAFAPPLIFLSWYAATKGRFIQFLMWSFLLASIKENMLLLSIMLSLYGFSKSPKENRNPWIILTILYSGIFLFLIFKLIPLFRNLPQHAFLVRYGNLGESPADLLLSPILHTQKFFTAIFNPINYSYLINLFDYLLIPAILSLTRLLPVTPLIIQHMLSIHYPEHTIFYHYIPTISPFIFLASMKTFKKIIIPTHVRWSKALLNGFYILAIFSLCTYAPDIKNRLNINSDTQETIARWQLINKIPTDAAVIATFNYLAPLSTREKLYSFHKVYDKAFQEPAQIKHSELNTLKAFTLPEDVHYALINLDDAWLLDRTAQKEQNTLGRIDNFYKDSLWKIIGRTKRTILLLR
ncbi:MAG: DUF2079 domain-containing protein [Candidatus Omnitrophica bacterium]|nr:DUF2079 domain-containing protein [Candidatus Omnitrophota bacterium]